MKTRQAVKWWNNRTDQEKINLIVKYSIKRQKAYCDEEEIEDDEIEEIWRKETQDGSDLEIIEEIFKEEIQQEVERGITITNTKEPQVDFEMLNTQINFITNNKILWLDRFEKHEMDNLELFFHLLSTKPTFAKKAYKELSKLH